MTGLLLATPELQQAPTVSAARQGLTQAQSVVDNGLAASSCHTDSEKPLAAVVYLIFDFMQVNRTFPIIVASRSQLMSVARQQSCVAEPEHLYKVVEAKWAEPRADLRARNCFMR